MSRKSEEEIQEIMEEYRDAPMVVGIKVCPGVYTDLFNGSFINSMFPQHFFLGFFPDTPLPVLTSVVICYSFSSNQSELSRL